MATLLQSLWHYAQNRVRGTSDRYHAHKHIITIPNLVTGLGVLGVVAYGYLAIHSPEDVWILLPIVILILASDMLDGVLADKLNQHSRIGKVLDTLRDRAFTGVLLLHIVLLDPAWQLILLAALVVILEGAIVVAEVWRRKAERHLYSKLRTIGQWSLLLGTVFLHQWLAPWVMIGSLTLVVCLSGVALLNHCRN